MTFEIDKERIKLPAQNNLTWVFPFRVRDAEGSVEREWLVDTFDLHLWFEEAVGRYPRHEGSDKETLRDLREHWDQLEPQLQRELARQAELGVVITIEGTRTSGTQRRAAAQVPKEKLPPLTKAQRKVADSLKVSEEEHARNLLAAERTRIELVNKTERLVSFLKQLLAANHVNAAIKEVTLTTWESKFDVALDIEGRRIHFRVDEAVFDDLLERGSIEAEHRLKRIIEVNLQVQVAQ